MDNKIIYQNHINMISIQLLYCMGGYVTYEVTISTGKLGLFSNAVRKTNVTGVKKKFPEINP